MRRSSYLSIMFNFIVVDEIITHHCAIVGSHSIKSIPNNFYDLNLSEKIKKSLNKLCKRFLEINSIYLAV